MVRMRWDPCKGCCGEREIFSCGNALKAIWWLESIIFTIRILGFFTLVLLAFLCAYALGCLLKHYVAEFSFVQSTSCGVSKKGVCVEAGGLVGARKVVPFQN